LTFSAFSFFSAWIPPQVRLEKGGVLLNFVKYHGRIITATTVSAFS